MVATNAGVNSTPAPPECIVHTWNGDRSSGNANIETLHMPSVTQRDFNSSGVQQPNIDHNVEFRNTNQTLRQIVATNPNHLAPTSFDSHIASKVYKLIRMNRSAFTGSKLGKDL